MPDNGFGSVSVSKKLLSEIDEMCQIVKADWVAQHGQSIKVSRADLIQMAVVFYKQRRNMPERKIKTNGSQD